MLRRVWGVTADFDDEGAFLRGILRSRALSKKDNHAVGVTSSSATQPVKEVSGLVVE